MTVETVDGRTLSGRVDSPKGDPDNTLTRPELEEKALRLAAWSGGATPREIQAATAAIWRFAEIEPVDRLLR